MGRGSSKENITYSTEISGSARTGESSIYIHPEAQRLTQVELPSKAATLFESFTSSVAKWGHNNCLGYQRKVDSKIFYKWTSYSSVMSQALKIGYGLDYLQLNIPDDTGYAYFGIYSPNRLEWILMDLACMSQSIVTIPLYDVQQIDSLERVIDEIQLKGLACTFKLLNKILNLKGQGRIPSLKTIIVFEKIQDPDILTSETAGINLISLKELEKLAIKGNVKFPTPDSWFTICFTSGTTGISKGAILSHKNMISTLAGITNTKLGIFPNDIHFSYLPLAHIFERGVCHLMLSSGASIGFYHGDISALFEDMIILRPTIFVSVPRVFKRLNDKIEEIISLSTGTRKKLTQRAIRIKLENYDTKKKITHKIYDKLIMKSFQNMIGGRVRIMVTGSAPIAPEVLRFLRVCFSCAFLEGYGQTEGCTGSTITYADDTSLGHVGGPMHHIELKLIDVPDMGYTSADVDKLGRSMPRGEVCIRGPSNFQGYFKSPELTREIIDEEGWLHTGDVGAILPENKALRIIDRKKNCFKLAQGEYVAAEKIENVYLSSPFVSQVFVYGDSLETYLIGIVVINEEFVRNNWLCHEGYDKNMSISEICKINALEVTVLKSMKEKAIENKLLGFEMVKKIFLESEVWTPNELLTPTQKLKRHLAKQKYQEIINKMYSEGMNN